MKMKSHAVGFIRLVHEARGRITELLVADLRRNIDRGLAFHLIDVREASDYQQGFIPQAIHLSKGVIERDIESQISDYEATIVVYCSGGFRSCLVAENLQKMGYSRVSSLTGGIKAWQEAGYLLITPV